VGDFDRAVKQQPDDPQSWAARADFFRATDQPLAPSRTTPAPSPQAGAYEIYNGLGFARLVVSDYAAAELAFDEAIRLRLDNPEPYRAAPWARAAMHHYRDAIDDFTLALGTNPAPPISMWNARSALPDSATSRMPRRTWTPR